MSLNVENLAFSYHTHTVLHDVSFDVHPGEFLSILGPNGAGKSTLFRCILGNLSAYTGNIFVDGTNLRTLPQRELAKRIAYIPQAHHPTFGYTVLDTVLMGTCRQVSTFSCPDHRQICIALNAMEQIGVSHLKDRYFNRLSGGEQQLVLVARAIAQQADILIMDEPTSSLDYGNQIRILQKVKRLSEEGYTVLLSTHNPQHAMSFSSRILALYDGTITAIGPPSQTLNPKLLETLYQIKVDFIDTPSGILLMPHVKGGDL